MDGAKGPADGFKIQGNAFLNARTVNAGTAVVARMAGGSDSRKLHRASIRRRSRLWVTAGVDKEDFLREQSGGEEFHS